MTATSTSSFRLDNGARQVRLPTVDDLRRARAVVTEHLSATPLIASRSSPGHTMLKLETFQPTGSFKIRGAIAATASLPRGSKIVTASAGNHALGIAWSSARLGVPATIVIAETASSAKRSALERLPIELIMHGHSYDAAESHGLHLASDPDRRATYVSPYNDPLVVAGHASILDEIIEQHPFDRPLTVVVPAGGGGLLSGIALRAEALATSDRPIHVYGVESDHSKALSSSVRAGTWTEVMVGATIADGLAGNIEPGSITIELLRHRIAGFVTVAERQLEDAIRFLVQDHGLIAEGAGAAALAAIHSGAIPDHDGDVVAIVSGRNIALATLASILEG